MQSELNGLSKQGKWHEMGTLIDDDILKAFAVVAEPDEVVPMIKARYGGVIDRLAITFGSLDPNKVPTLIAELKSA